MAFDMEEGKVRRAHKKPRGIGVVPMAIIIVVLVSGSWWVGFILQKEFNVQAYDLLNPYPAQTVPAPQAPQAPVNFNG